MFIQNKKYIMNNWGRATKVGTCTFIFMCFVLWITPLIISFVHFTNNEIGFDLNNIKNRIIFDFNIFSCLLCWIGFQLILSLLPDFIHKLTSFYVGGKRTGQTTPAGFILEYNINGLQAWIITHIIYFTATYIDIIDPSIIAKNFNKIFICANVIGYLLAIFSYYKAHNFPTHIEDNKQSNSIIYDFVMGIEFNPRIWNIDFKLFFNGRPGIIAWTMINYSFAFLQYEKFGSISNSMILVNILQTLYVIDFFWNENWYLKTVDIAHDHFGWYLAWGDCVWLPFFYTLQSTYLSYNYVVLSNMQFIIILLAGIIGYTIFRLTNYQKDYFRREKNPTIFGKTPEYLEVKYVTSNEETHTSKLLCDGLWKYARHMNYSGDLLLSLTYGLSCGFESLIPYYYFFFMLTLLILRCYRDEHRCYKKYGYKWTEYCKIVPYRLVPFVY